MLRPPPRSTLFPYTTLSRSIVLQNGRIVEQGESRAMFDNPKTAYTRELVEAVPQPARACRRFRSEEHTSELQSRRDLVCRLLLEKKKKNVILIDKIRSNLYT